MECSITKILAQTLYKGQIFGINQSSGNAQLKHEFSRNLGLSVTIYTDFLNVDIVIHIFTLPSLVYQIFCLGVVEYRTL